MCNVPANQGSHLPSSSHHGHAKDGRVGVEGRCEPYSARQRHERMGPKSCQSSAIEAFEAAKRREEQGRREGDSLVVGSKKSGLGWESAVREGALVRPCGCFCRFTGRMGQSQRQPPIRQGCSADGGKEGILLSRRNRDMQLKKRRQKKAAPSLVMREKVG